MREHIALVSGPFFRTIEGRLQYETRWHQREEEHGCADASGSHCSPSRGPARARERDRKPLTPKASRAHSKSQHKQNVREPWSCSRKQVLSQTPRGGSPHDSSSSRGRKLPTPPQPSCNEMSKRAESLQMASRDVMEVTKSPPLSWEDRVQEEEDEQEKHSSVGGDSQPCPSPACMEGCSISDISMAEEGPQQGDSNIVVEEEVEESMETDEPSNIDAPAPLPDKVFPEGSEAEAEDDRHSHALEESTDQNPPHNLDLDEDELLGLPTDISIPGGHSDDSVALVVSPGDDNL